MGNPKVGIIVLNWNNTTDTIECLSSVFKIRYDNYFIIVVDNGSTDDSLINITTTFPNIEVLPLDSNYGYAGGNNWGISKALSLGAEYVFLLNNDTTVSPSILDELVFIAKGNEKIGMVGPKMYCTHQPDVLFARGSFVMWQKGEILHRGMFTQETATGEECPEMVDFIVGCGILVSKQVIETIGSLNEDYFLNCEDVEWGIRAKRYGYEVWYAPKAVLWHKISSTLGFASASNTYYMTRNNLSFFSRNSTGIWKIIVPMKIIIKTLRTIIAWTFISKYNSLEYRKKRLAKIYAIRDYFLKRFGKMGPDVSYACLGKM